MLKFGPEVELNPRLKAAAIHNHLDGAIFGYVLVPSLVTISALTLLRWQTVLAVLFGIRLTFGYFQVLSLAFEKQLDAKLKKPGA